MSTKLVNHKMVVGDPERMIRDAESGDPICPECNESFILCTCPKPWSSLETDGFQVYLEGERFVAYPGQDTYREEMLWITGTPHQLKCGICKETMDADWRWSKDETMSVACGFFEVHKWCYSANSNNGSQYEI